MEASVSTDANRQAVIRNVRGMKGWLKFIGIVTIISGALQALSIIGILWAWLPIWLGVILSQAGSRAGDYLDRQDDAALAQFTGKLKTYFVISGVVLIVSLALGVLAGIFWVIVVLAGGFALPSFLQQLQGTDWSS